jgi:hypothetical protein
MPAVAAALERRCRLVATASGYGSTADFSGLPDHLTQLQAVAEAGRQAQIDAWRSTLEQTKAMSEALEEAAALLARLLEEHKLQGQRASLFLWLDPADSTSLARTAVMLSAQDHRMLHACKI